jgi:cysteinyl-tRNA synthetase
MVRLIARLIATDNAYTAEGHVLFHVPTMADYGRLSNRSLDEMQAGARVEVAPYKKDPMDFVLWKPSKPGEPSWPSPWGDGRPGWHIECSAMAGALLGPVFDIHGGGIDLIFPHHENEIAQSRCAHGTDAMANYWLHNGFLQVEGEKMSKSLGNFVTIRDLLADWPGEVIRLNMLRTHYRQPMDWTVSGLREAGRTLDHWYDLTGDSKPGLLCADAVDALCDDLNTPKALAALHELRGEAAAGSAGAKASLKASAEMLGLLTRDRRDWVAAERSAVGIDEARISDFVAARVAARKAKNFAEADRIRAELEKMGIMLKDAKDPATGELVTTWEVRRWAT